MLNWLFNLIDRLIGNAAPAKYEGVVVEQRVYYYIDEPTKPWENELLMSAAVQQEWHALLQRVQYPSPPLSEPRAKLS